MTGFAELGGFGSYAAGISMNDLPQHWKLWPFPIWVFEVDEPIHGQACRGWLVVLDLKTRGFGFSVAVKPSFRIRLAREKGSMFF